MDDIKNNKEYSSIVKHILDNQAFSQTEDIKHHDSNRLHHSLKVSYYSYLVAKKLRLDYHEVARGGLLHDFYLERTVDYKELKDKVKLYTCKHPGDAIENSKLYFDLSEKEEDMIRTHMFPLDYHVPKYAESWVVNLVDTGVSVCDFAKKFGYRMSYLTNLYLLLFLNVLK